MKKPSFTDKAILAAKKCGDIFTNDTRTAKAEYRELSRKFHPDKYNGDSAVMARINSLYDKALHLFSIGEWEKSNQITLVPRAGKATSHNYLSEKPFELGTFYICDCEVIYILDSQHEKYYRNAIKRIESLKFASDRMKKEMSRFMPELKFNYRLKDDRWCMGFKKTEDVFALEDLLSYFDGEIPPQHSAWIISRLSNICCYFDYMNIAHNGVSLSNCFVSPKHHTIILLGGWWYCAGQGERMIGTQKAIYDVIPVREKGDKTSTIVTDLESSKLIGRLILGKKNATTPQAMTKFLQSGSQERAVDEFNKWDSALTEAFGVRKFIELDVAKSDIYKN